MTTRFSKSEIKKDINRNKIQGYITVQNIGYKGQTYFSVEDVSDFRKWFIQFKKRLSKSDKVDIHCDNPEIKRVFNQLWRWR